MKTRSVNVDPGAFAWRYGVVIVRNDREYAIHRRWIPRIPSRLEAWIDANWRRLPDNQLNLYYNAPFRCPGFLVLAYIRAGHHTSVETLRSGLSVLDEIATMKRMQAIVCEATNPRLTSRVMAYFGYIRHAHHLKGQHYIKRLTTGNE